MGFFGDWGKGDAWSPLTSYVAWNADGPLWERNISILPLELLCASFKHLSLEGLVTATHVCRYWRFAALSHAKLWCNIDTSNRYQFVTMLALSRNSPLLVTIQVSPPKARLDIRNRIVEGNNSTHEECLDLELHEYAQEPVP